LGLSVYDPEEIQEFDGEVDMLQIPVNVLDGRFTKHKFHPTWTVIARSVFLQGLLLMEELPTWVSTEARWMIRTFIHACRAQRLMAYEAALGYVIGLDEIDKVIVGVNSSKQLEQLLTVEPLKWEYNFSITDGKVLDPRRWPSEDDRCPIHGVYGVCLECVKGWTKA
jgi:aryl-alcohol dehydrogenase-like predicted oxidoreductase